MSTSVTQASLDTYSCSSFLKDSKHSSESTIDENTRLMLEDNPILCEWKELALNRIYVFPNGVCDPKRCTCTTIGRLLEKLFLFCKKMGLGVYHCQEQLPSSFATFGLIMKTVGGDEFSLLIWYADTKRERLYWELKKHPRAAEERGAAPLRDGDMALEPVKSEPGAHLGVPLDILLTKSLQHHSSSSQVRSSARSVSLELQDDETTGTVGLDTLALGTVGLDTLAFLGELGELLDSASSEQPYLVDDDKKCASTEMEEIIDSCTESMSQLLFRLQRKPAVETCNAKRLAALQEMLVNLETAVKEKLVPCAPLLPVNQVLSPIVRKRSVGVPALEERYDHASPVAAAVVSPTSPNKRQCYQPQPIQTPPESDTFVVRASPERQQEASIQLPTISPDNGSTFRAKSLGLQGHSDLTVAVRDGTLKHIPDLDIPENTGIDDTCMVKARPSQPKPVSLVARQVQPKAILNQAEIHVKQYQFVVNKATDLKTKVALLDEMYLTGANYIAEVRDVRGCKRFMQRAYRVARCIHDCFHGSKESFCADRTKLTLGTFECHYLKPHDKVRGEQERLVNLPASGIPTSKPALGAAEERMSRAQQEAYRRSYQPS